MGKSFNKIKRNFTIMPNEILHDRELSIYSKVLYWYMCSKPDDWDFISTVCASELNISLDSFRKYMKELVETGWVTKGEQVKENGKFGNVEYIVNECPIAGYDDSPCGVITDTESFRHGSYRARKNPTQYNTNNTNTDIKQNTDEDLIHMSDSKKREIWRDEIVEYQMIVSDATEKVLADEEHKAKMENWYSNLDYEKTVAKTADWWMSDEGWMYAKKKRKGNIDMVMTLKRNLERNRIYKRIETVGKTYMTKAQELDERLRLAKLAKGEY